MIVFVIFGGAFLGGKGRARATRSGPKMEDDRNSVPAQGEGSGLEFKLHPLVIINISDHFTRCSLNFKENGRVLGCLLGEQTGRVVHITNTFEMRLEGENEEAKVDRNFLSAKKEQYKTVFPDLEVVGWYRTGGEVREVEDLRTHAVIGEVNESPVFLLMDSKIKEGSRDLPISLYETELRVSSASGGAPSPHFVGAKYTVDSLEAERIAVDQVARIVPSGKTSTTDQLTSHMTGMQNAVKMLRDRIAVILETVKAMRDGKIPTDHGLLREVSSLARRLPVGTSKVDHELGADYDDTLMMAYLSVMTKGNAKMHEVINKMNATYDSRVASHHRRGLF